MKSRTWDTLNATAEEHKNYLCSVCGSDGGLRFTTGLSGRKKKNNSGFWQSLRQTGGGGGNAGLSPGHVNVVHSNQNVGFFFYYFKLLCPEKI